MNIPDKRVARTLDHFPRRLLYRLSKIAERQKCAIVCVRRLNMGGGTKAIYRGNSSKFRRREIKNPIFGSLARPSAFQPRCSEMTRQDSTVAAFARMRADAKTRILANAATAAFRPHLPFCETSVHRHPSQLAPVSVATFTFGESSYFGEVSDFPFQSLVQAGVVDYSRGEPNWGAGGGCSMDAGAVRIHFPSTAWSCIRTVQDRKHKDHVPAVNRFVDLYWRPVFYFLRARRVPFHEAEDITQEFLWHFVDKGAVSADARKGKFRTFLLTVLKRFLSDRGPRAPRQKKFEREFASIQALMSEPELSPSCNKRDKCVG